VLLGKKIRVFNHFMEDHYSTYVRFKALMGLLGLSYCAVALTTQLGIGQGSRNLIKKLAN